MLLRIAGLCGVLWPVVTFICIAFAILNSPWFSWTDNWLSDIGGLAGERPIWMARGIASVVFNVGLIVSGIMGLVFATAIRRTSILSTSLGRIGTLLFILDMFFLCGIGVFPETTGDPHTIVSTAFFLLVVLSLLSIGLVLRKSSEKKIGSFIIILGIVSLCSIPLFLIPRPWGSNAIAEMFSIVSISAFALVFGFGLLKGKFKSKQLSASHIKPIPPKFLH